MSGAAIDAFERNYRLLNSGEQTNIPEAQIEPAEDLVTFEGIQAKDPGDGTRFLGNTVVIKLNGGLGTGMGLEKAKSLLVVREGLTFLDLIARQVLAQRESSGKKLRFVLMNSYSTSADTMEYLEQYAELGGADELEMMQSRVPKIEAATMAPAEFPERPELEWCPPGHGDLYASLLGPGLLERLLDEGVKYAFVSNSDNLGATRPGHRSTEKAATWRGIRNRATFCFVSWRSVRRPTPTSSRTSIAIGTLIRTIFGSGSTASRNRWTSTAVFFHCR